MMGRGYVGFPETQKDGWIILRIALKKGRGEIKYTVYHLVV
jgi:hypothetical protein